MVDHQCFVMNFRHAAGITCMNHDHGPLLDKSEPPSQFAGYGSVTYNRTDSREQTKVLTVLLWEGKMDLFSVGAHLYLGQTGDTLCPVAAVLEYLAICQANPDPLFAFQDGTPLSWAQMVTHLHGALVWAGIDTTNFSGHSFQISAALTAAQASLNLQFSHTLWW